MCIRDRFYNNWFRKMCKHCTIGIIIIKYLCPSLRNLSAGVGGSNHILKSLDRPADYPLYIISRAFKIHFRSQLNFIQKYKANFSRHSFIVLLSIFPSNIIVILGRRMLPASSIFLKSNVFTTFHNLFFYVFPIFLVITHPIPHHEVF